MSNEQTITLPKSGRTEDVSDGYHSFKELYEHRHALFLNLMKLQPEISWISQKHQDGLGYKGWFIAGIRLEAGDISYHLPMCLWDEAKLTGARIAPRAPKWDGHRSEDVVKRLQANLNTPTMRDKRTRKRIDRGGRIYSTYRA